MDPQEEGLGLLSSGAAGSGMWPLTGELAASVLFADHLGTVTQRQAKPRAQGLPDEQAVSAFGVQ